MLGTTGVSRQLGAAQARETQDTVHAQRIQSRKNIQHAEEVENLDEGAVDAVRDDQQKHHNEDEDDHPPRREPSDDPAEHVDIAELKDAPRLSKPAKPATPRRLDISA